MRRQLLNTVGLLAVVAGLLLAGCAEVGQERTEAEQVELGSAESARVQIEMGAGVLVIGGGQGT